MSLLGLFILSLSVSTLASPLITRQAPNFSFPGDAPFSVDVQTLAASLTCPNGYPTSSSPPVLLVHGTATTGDATWGQGYVPALLANGYTACYVDIPNRAMGDMQINSEYVAYSLHHISQLSGGQQTAVIAHSQGNPDTQWALQFWPSTRNVTRAFVSLSPDFAGIELFDIDLSKACIGNSLCQASLWQQSAGSNYYTALHDRNFHAQVPTTTIWSQFDGIVMPPRNNAQLPSATVIRLQDLCPLRPTTHFDITLDAPAYNIALDALNNGGAADLSRVRQNAPLACFRLAAKGMQITVPTQLLDDYNAVVQGILFGPGRVAVEPAVAAYALALE